VRGLAPALDVVRGAQHPAARRAARRERAAQYGGQPRGARTTLVPRERAARESDVLLARAHAGQRRSSTFLLRRRHGRQSLEPTLTRTARGYGSALFRPAAAGARRQLAAALE